jgi:hypothetical protein
MEYTKDTFPKFITDKLTTYLLELGMIPQAEIETELLRGLLSQMESDPAFIESVNNPKYKITPEDARKKLLKNDFLIFGSKFLNSQELQNIIFNFLVDEKFKLQNIKITENALTKNMDFVTGIGLLEDLKVEISAFFWKKRFSNEAVVYPLSIKFKILE